MGVAGEDADKNGEISDGFFWQVGKSIRLSPTILLWGEPGPFVLLMLGNNPGNKRFPALRLLPYSRSTAQLAVVSLAALRDTRYIHTAVCTMRIDRPRCLRATSSDVERIICSNIA